MLFLLGIFFIFQNAPAYPNFIGYGYTTCAVCHYNTQGNGPLTDYGRALFSQEIAARPFLPRRITDEQLADYSGFIPGKEAPAWFHPSLKYRSLWFNSSAFTSQQKERSIEMQRDVNLVIATDQTARTILSVTYGLLPLPKAYYKPGVETNSITREHYLRTYFGPHFLVAVGLMDKVYGLRISDHTAVSRSQIGFGQDDQVHGALLEYSDEKWVTALHLFSGNLMKPSSDRQKGLTLFGEYEVVEKNRLGFSYAQFATDFVASRRLAIHDRWGLQDLFGSSLLFELGLKDDKKITDAQSKMGSYGLLEATLFLTRGYSILSTLERTQPELKASVVDTQKWSLGFLTFPFQRVEVRLSAVQTKGFSTESAVEDQYSILGQLHVSL